MMNVLAIDDRRWLDFVQSRPEASLFHHPVWAQLLADCYGYRAMALALAEGGTVTAGLPVIDTSRPLGGRRWVSLPFTDRCTPLAGGRQGELVTGLADLAAWRKLGVLEVRAGLPQDTKIQSTAAFVRHTLSLSVDTRRTWDHFFKNHRRNVRIAERSGVRIVRGASAADLETFYRLHLRTRRRLGVPTQPRRFFTLLLERVIQPGLGFMVSAYSGDVPVATAIFGSWNGTVIYKYSARDERFAKLDANYLLLWSAIRWSGEEGCHTFDLGRSHMQQVDLRTFKSGWGAVEEALPYSWIATAPVKAPSGVAERALALAIRSCAPWFCRAVGELFYKYAA